MKYFRNCPKCENILAYSNINNLNAAIKQKSLCFDCASKSHTGKLIYDYTNHFDTTENKYFYICNGCQNKIYLSNKRGIRRAISKKNMCLTCTMNKKEVKAKCSKIRTLAHENPNSSYNDPEYVKKRSKISKETITKLNHSPNNPSYKFINKEKSSARLKGMLNDPDSNLNKAIKTEEYRKKLSKAQKLKWQNPDYICHSKEYKEKANQRLLKGAFKLGQKTSKGEKELADLLSIYGFIHNDFSIKIDGYFPDLIHLEKKIIVEYNGDLFHANPNIDKYKNDDAIIKLPKRTMIAGEIRKRDAIRKQILEKAGYKVYIVWENDFKSKFKRQIILDDIIVLLN